MHLLFFFSVWFLSSSIWQNPNDCSSLFQHPETQIITFLSLPLEYPSIMYISPWVTLVLLVSPLVDCEFPEGKDRSGSREKEQWCVQTTITVGIRKIMGNHGRVGNSLKYEIVGNNLKFVLHLEYTFTLIESWLRIVFLWNRESILLFYLAQKEEHAERLTHLPRVMWQVHSPGSHSSSQYCLLWFSILSLPGFKSPPHSNHSVVNIY